MATQVSSIHDRFSIGKADAKEFDDFVGSFVKLNFDDGASSSKKQDVKPRKEKASNVEKGVHGQQTVNECKDNSQSVTEPQKLDQSSKCVEVEWDDSVPECYVDNSFSITDLDNNYYRGLIEMMDANCDDDDNDNVTNPYLEEFLLKKKRVMMEKKERNQRLVKAFLTLKEEDFSDFFKKNGYAMTAAAAPLQLPLLAQRKYFDFGLPVPE